MTPPPDRVKDRLRLAAVAVALLFVAAALSARVASSRAPAAAAPPQPPAPAVPAAAAAQATLPPADFKNFEAPQVHPLALTPDGTRLLAVNSPNATLSVFQLSGGAPVLTAEIPVGLGPVSVAARNNREAWVVNWLSDSVSVVDLVAGNTVRTFDVGDEPTDVLFAGTSREMAFVCVSGGGQLTVSGRQITGSSGAVKVFDPSNPNAAPQVIEVFAKQPRALARDAAGGRVFVSVFESGNQTTIIPEAVVRGNGGLPPPSPAMRAGLPAAPNTGLNVRWNGAAWADETGDTKWDALVNYTLADIDLVTIDATGQAPAAGAQLRGLGTHLGNMAFDPSAGRLLVVNLESDSVRRFEPNLRGRFQTSRVSVLNASEGGAPALASVQDLNPHVDLSNPAGTDAERALSLAVPADIARASDGTLYVAATGSAKVGFLDASGAVQGRIAVGQGPTGLALDEARSRLYVLNRLDQTVSVVDTAAKAQLSQTPAGFNPEPPAVREGRRFLYDASFSAHGTVSCASCHPGGHRDGIAWDLGDPTGSLVTLNNFTHHPMKGPMMTQSLRGLFNATPLHWRADRRNVSEFNVAFTDLLGSTRPLTPEEMASFTAFVNTLTYPPNPNENLDRTLPNPPTGPNARIGSDRFRSFRSGLDPNSAFQTIFLGNANNCNACHLSVPTIPNHFGIGTIRQVFPGAILSEPQAFKVPQLRGVYQKAGLQKPAPGQPRAEQITGFGFMHDGSIDTLLNFMRQPDFIGFRSDDERRDIEAFLLANDTVIAPAVGLQVTLGAENKSSPETLARLNLLVQQAQVVVVPGAGAGVSIPSCDLVVRGLYGGAQRSFLQLSNGVFQPDSASEANVSLQQLIDAVGPGAELTFTGVPVGEGRRIALDRDGDGVLNDDEPRTSVQLTGRVVDAAGNGVAGVTVRLGGAQSAVAQTDAAGRFVFGGVSTAGTHTLTPSGGGMTFAPASRTVVRPAWNQTAYFVTPAGPAAATEATQFFVTQHYNDFFGRDPDALGLAFWSNQINECQAIADAAERQRCHEVRRINVSAAFYLSVEFQRTGFLLHRLTEASFDRMPRYGDFFADTQRLGRGVVVGAGNWETLLDANASAFLKGWVERPAFRAIFDALTNEQYVERLVANAGIDGQIDKAALVAGLNANTETRAGVLRRVAESDAFIAREKNRAFVLMQYLGYLRRNPEDPPEATLDLTGFNFWLTKLDNHGGNFVEAEMVKSFLVSGEYQGRFRQ